MEQILPEDVERPWSVDVLDQSFRLWIEPAIATRGLDLTRDQVRAAAVIMPPDGPIKVLLNDDLLSDDVHLVASAVAQRPLEAGESVTAADLVDIRHLEPVGIDPNAGWLAFANIGGVITLAFDFCRNRQTASGLLTRAGEFLGSARHALDQGYLGPAVENGFAAAELAVKAQMYLIWDDPPRDHRRRLTWWKEWVELGNAPSNLGPLVGRLWSERPRSRYGDGELTMTPAQISDAINDVAQLVEHSGRRCSPAKERRAEEETNHTRVG